MKQKSKVDFGLHYTNKHHNKSIFCLLCLSLFYSFSLLAQPYINVVINEISGDGGNVEAGNDAIVELAGPPGTNIGCMVLTNTEWAIVLPANTLIPSDGIFLIGCEERNNASNGFYTGIHTGLSCQVCDFPGLVVDFDVCNDANAAYISTSLYTTYGFTLDNQSCEGNTDGDQVILFRPDGTPHDAIYWGAADNTNSNGGGRTIGGSSGDCGVSADHVTVQIGQAYTLGDNDDNGIINDYLGTHRGFKSNGANALAVNFMPDGNDDFGNPEIEGMVLVIPPGDCNAASQKYIVPPLSDPVWVNAGLALVSCNSTFIRMNDTSPAGNSTQTAKVSTTSSHKDDPDLNPDWVAYATNALVPSSINSVMATSQWQITNHPNPSEPNDADAWDFFYNLGAGDIEITAQNKIDLILCNSQTVTFKLKVYNYQHVEPTIRTAYKAGSFVRDETGTDQAWTINSVGSTVTTGGYPSTNDGITTFTFISNNLTAGNTHSFTLVWDDYTDCCGSGNNRTVVNQTIAHECYEKIAVTIKIAEALTVSDNEITCPEDFRTNIGLIDFSTLVTSPNASIQYQLKEGVTIGMEMMTGVLVSTNTTGIFNLPNTLASNLALIIKDLANCGTDQVIRIGDACRTTPPCPNPNGTTISTNSVCPNENFTLSVDAALSTNLPNSGTIDWYYGTLGFNPHDTNERTLLGQSTITTTFPKVPTTGPFINEVLVDAAENDGNGGEFIEIGGISGMDVGCFILTDGDDEIILPAGTVIPPDGFLLMASGKNTNAPATSIDIDLDNCNCFSNPMGANNAADLQFTNHSETNGEFLFLYDASGIFIDGILWGGPSTNGGNNHPDASALHIIRTTPVGCVIPASLNRNGQAYVDVNVKSASNGISIELDEITGNWQSTNDAAGSTPGSINSGALPTSTIIDLVTSLDESFCNQTIEIRGIIQPATITGTCTETDITTVALSLTINCPTADLQNVDKELCLPVNSSEVLATVDLADGSGLYHTSIQLADNGSIITFNKNNVSHPLQITYEDIVTALGKTTFSNLELSIVRISDANGKMCTGKEMDEVIILTVQESPTAVISSATDLTDCSGAENGSITVDFSPATSGAWEFEYSINDGDPILGAANTNSFTLPVSNAGIYELKSVSNIAGCMGTIGEPSTQTVNAPTPLTLTAVNNITVCNNGLQTIDLNRDISITINNNGIEIVGNAATLGNIIWYSSDPTLLPITHRSLINVSTTVFNPIAEQDYYFIYKRSIDDCEIIVKTTVSISSTACCQADAGDIILPSGYSSGTRLCQGEDLLEFTVSYAAIDETNPDNTNFQYIFLLTNSDSTIIQQTAGDFDFTDLAAGKYNVHGISYANSNTPANVTVYLEEIKNDADKNDIAQIEVDENSLNFCLNLDGLTENGHELIEVLNPLTLVAVSNASLCNDDLHTIDLDTAITITIADNGTILKGTGMTLGNITWYSADPNLMPIAQRSTIILSDTKVSPTMEQDYYFSYQRPTDNCEVIGKTTVLLTNTLCCQADAGDITLPTDYSSGTALCQGEDLLEFTVSYAAADETNPDNTKFQYIFLLTNSDSTIIQQTTRDFDFTDLAAGKYNVYGLSYANSNTPTSLDDYISAIKGDADKNDLAQIETNESSLAYCLNMDGLTESGHELIEILSPLNLIAVSNASLCNDGLHAIDLDTVITVTIDDNGNTIMGTAITLDNMTWYNSDPTLMPIAQRSTIALSSTIVSPTIQRDYYFTYKRPTDNCEVVGKTTILLTNTLCCQADAGDITLPTDYSSGTALCQGEDLLEFTVSYAAADETNPDNTKFQYIFLLTNSDSTIIQQTKGDFDFTDLAAGKYNVYGLSYANSNIPTSLDDYISSIKGDADKNDIAQIEGNESSLAYCLNFDGLTESGYELIEILSPLNLVAVSNASLCNDGLHTIDLDTAITITIADNGTILKGTGMILDYITWYNSDPTLMPITQRSTIALSSTIVSPIIQQDYYFTYKRPTDNCEVVGRTTILLTNTLCCQADAGDIILPSGYSSGTGLCQGEDLPEFTVSYAATDEMNPDNTNFQYIFLLTNSDSTIIQQTNGDFDFTDLAAGKYNVYGLSYANSNIPTSLDDYISSIKGDADKNDIAQIEGNESSLVYCLNLDGLTESGHELIEILSPLNLVAVSNASLCNDGLHTIDLDTAITVIIDDNGNTIMGTAITLGNITWYNSDPNLMSITQRSTIALSSTIVSPTIQRDYYFTYKRPTDNCEVVGRTTILLTNTLCCQADAGDITLPSGYSSGTGLCQGEDLPEFTVSYAATDEMNPDNTNFQYIFLLTNSDSTIIQQTNGDFDFTDLAAGKYNVYGLSYANSNIPTSLDDYISSIKGDADKNDIAQIEGNESSLAYCLNIDGLLESGHELIEVLGLLNLVAVSNASICNDGLHAIDLDTAITVTINDNGNTIMGTAITLGNITWYSSDPTLMPIAQRSTIALSSTIVRPIIQRDYYFIYKRPTDNCEVVGRTTILLTNTLCCQADAGDIVLPTDYSSGTALCQGEDLLEFTVSYAAADETNPDDTKFQYIFLLTNSDSTIIQQTNGDFDFTDLAVGKYNVYGLSYANSNTPTSLDDYINSIKGDADKNDIAQIEGNESSLAYCLNIDGLTESGHELIEILSPLNLVAVSNASICNDGLHAIDLDTAVIITIDDNGSLLEGTGMTLGNITWYNSDPTLMPIAQRSTIVLPSTLVSLRTQQDYYFIYKRPTDNCEVVGQTTILLTNTLCCQADAGDIILPIDYNSGDTIFQGEDLFPFMVSYAAIDEVNPDSTNFQYTFLLVDSDSTIVQQTKGDFDFTDLPIGNYNVYGLSYANSNRPSSLDDYINLIRNDVDKNDIAQIEENESSLVFCLNIDGLTESGIAPIIIQPLSTQLLLPTPDPIPTLNEWGLLILGLLLLNMGILLIKEHIDFKGKA